MKDTTSDDVWVLVDTETDGLCKPIRALEIAAQRYSGMNKEGPAFRVFLNHQIPIPTDALAIHGYDAVFLANHGIDPIDAYNRFWDYVAGARVVAHFAGFDWTNVLLPETERLGVQVRGQFGFCTWRLARRALPEHHTWRLDHLREQHGLRGGRPHSAIGDVEATGDLVTRIIQPITSRVGFSSIGEMAAFSQLPLQLSRSIVSGSPEADPDTAVQNALAKEGATKARLAAEAHGLEERLRVVQMCDEKELLTLAASLGYLEESSQCAFQDKVFVFTGTFAAFKRKFAESEVISRGGIAVEKQKFKLAETDYLVIGEAKPGGGKLRGVLMLRQEGASKPLILCEQEFIAALSASEPLKPSAIQLLAKTRDTSATAKKVRQVIESDYDLRSFRRAQDKASEIEKAFACYKFITVKKEKLGANYADAIEILRHEVFEPLTVEKALRLELLFASLADSVECTVAAVPKMIWRSYGIDVSTDKAEHILVFDDLADIETLVAKFAALKANERHQTVLSWATNPPKGATVQTYPHTAQRISVSIEIGEEKNMTKSATFRLSSKIIAADSP